jgi:hypothetical protein
LFQGKPLSILFPPGFSKISCCSATRRVFGLAALVGENRTAPILHLALRRLLLQRHSARVRPRGFDRGNPHGILFPPGCSKAPVAAASARVDGARPLLLSLHNAFDCIACGCAGFWREWAERVSRGEGPCAYSKITNTISLKAARELKKTLASLTPFGMTSLFIRLLFGAQVGLAALFRENRTAPILHLALRRLLLQRHWARVRPRGFDRGKPHGISLAFLLLRPRWHLVPPRFSGACVWYGAQFALRQHSHLY